MEQPKVIVLEDEPLIGECIRTKVASVSSRILCVIVETSAELAEILLNTSADVFALDDNVPPISGAKPIRAFLENAEKVRESFPKATIIYIGGDPKEPEIQYCEEHGIPMVNKLDLAVALEENDLLHHQELSQ